MEIERMKKGSATFLMVVIAPGFKASFGYEMFLPQ